MDFSKSLDSRTRASPLPTTDTERTTPHGPQPTSRWECPARYMPNHQPQDGRPLCQYCECWNPAPFLNERLPIELARLSTLPILPEAMGFSSQVSGIQLPIRLAVPPPVASPLYTSYNLCPAPESRLGHISVRHLPPHFRPLLPLLDKLIQTYSSNHIRQPLKTLPTFLFNFLD